MSSSSPSPPPSRPMPLFLISVTLRVQLWGFCSPVEQDGALCQSGLTASLASTRGWPQLQHSGASVSSGPVFWAHSLLSPSRERLPRGLAGREGPCTTVRHLMFERFGSDFSMTTCEYTDVHSAQTGWCHVCWQVCSPRYNGEQLCRTGTITPLTDKKMGLREATMMLLWQYGNCMSQLS